MGQPFERGLAVTDDTRPQVADRNIPPWNQAPPDVTDVDAAQWWATRRQTGGALPHQTLKEWVARMRAARSADEARYAATRETEAQRWGRLTLARDLITAINLELETAELRQITNTRRGGNPYRVGPRRGGWRR